MFFGSQTSFSQVFLLFSLMPLTSRISAIQKKKWTQKYLGFCKDIPGRSLSQGKISSHRRVGARLTIRSRSISQLLCVNFNLASSLLACDQGFHSPSPSREAIPPCPRTL